MAWVTPKDNWTTSDYINYTDYNRIKNNVYALLSIIAYNTIDRTLTTGETYNLNMHTWDDTIRSTYVLRFTTATQEWQENYVIEYPQRRSYSFTATEATTVTMWFIETPTGVPAPVPDDMGADKAVNDLWYADEFNTIIENIDRMAESVGLDFYNKPFYAPNGATPTAEELNTIERTTQNLYNLINNPYRIYLGIGGYVGGRLTNALL